MTGPSPVESSSPQQTYRLMAGMAIAMMILLGVAIFSLSRLSTTPWTSPLRPPDIQTSVGTPLPAFQYKNEGKLLTPQNFIGQWTLLSFWSFTCPPCMEELPALNQLFTTWTGPSFEVITVNIDQGENAEQAKGFLEEQQISLPTLYDADHKLKDSFAVNEYPRHFLINPDGKIVWSATGAFRWNDSHARDQLTRLMEQQTPENPDDTGPSSDSESEE